MLVNESGLHQDSVIELWLQKYKHCITQEKWNRILELTFFNIFLGKGPLSSICSRSMSLLFLPGKSIFPE